ncbi:glycoside hydrolase family 6 protein [Nocardioides sp. BP30]|uniref:glycoside hydrolase family 6 protein n=1 Tax=Nocardioides sp. BP30 TaxID=3036374 RepID=UPI002469BE15|nr:glycoside hydrolase family 6 protein [Nocardioides sp. BP30]WGL52775.1 glycoside hydrolase family 6 protein [Nocardioides sp. BP30]
MRNRIALPLSALATGLLVLTVALAGTVGVIGRGGGAQAAQAPVGIGAKKLTTYDVDMSGAPLAQNPTNPLAGGRWSVNTGYWDNLYPAYAAATGTDRTYLAKSALQPRMLWFTIGNSAHRPGAVSSYIAQEQHGDPSVLVQLAIFGIWGFKGEGNRTKHKLTAKEKATYRSWIGRVSAEIGSSRVAIVLEPDLALTAKRSDQPKKQRTKGAAARQGLTRYAAQTFAAHNPRAAVYLDAGDADWLSTAQAATMLQKSGIAYTRGFALGATHYSATSADVDHGAAIASALAAQGIHRHFVIDTADNGRPFTYSQFYAKHPHRLFDDSAPCKSATATVCNALGVPPTWKVTSTPVPLTAAQRGTAAQLVDGYLWFGRPWLRNQATPFVRSKAIRAGMYSPY